MENYMRHSRRIPKGEILSESQDEFLMNSRSFWKNSGGIVGDLQEEFLKNFKGNCINIAHLPFPFLPWSTITYKIES